MLFLGFFILEGFDFGVGMLMEPFGRVGHRRPGAPRRAALNTIEQVWDGNEVWLLTAGGAVFAAYPGWYATVFSTLYLPLLAILFGMIVRVVRHRVARKNRRPTMAPLGRTSALPWVRGCLPCLWGVAFAILVQGLPIDAGQPVNLAGHRRAERLHTTRRAGHLRLVPVARSGVRGPENRGPRAR